MLVEQRVIWDFMRHCKGILHCDTSQARGDLPQNSCSLPCTESWQLRVGLLTSLDQGYRFTWDLRCISKYKFVQAEELPEWKIKDPIWLGDIGGKLWFGVPQMPNKIIGCQPLFFVMSCHFCQALADYENCSEWPVWYAVLMHLLLRTASESLKLVGASTCRQLQTQTQQQTQKEHQQDDKLKSPYDMLICLIVF